MRKDYGEELFSRRCFLQVGALGVGGLSFANVCAGRAATAYSNLQTSVILLYLHGGASQLETYDLKPSAPSSYRSVFEPIATNVPGLDICELFPRQAQIADKFSLVRSIHHDIGIHSDGGILVLTGKRPSRLDPTSQSKSEHPDFGSVASRVRGMNERAIPPYIAIPAKPYMTRPTYLGLHHGAFELSDPSVPGYAGPQIRVGGGEATASLSDRRQLLARLDGFRSHLDLTGQVQGMRDFHELAFQMLTSPETAQAFDLKQEPDTLRDRYGRHLWGQGCLLARRLAEAGTAVISLYIDAPKTGPDFTNWDDHSGNAGRPGHFAGYMRTRLPYLDQALSALIEDIFAKGLDQKMLVVVMGEFGRTPRLSTNSMGVGRDHWPDAATVLLSGGGLRMGQVVGATNSKAEFPTERPYKPQDVLATIYRHLGIDSRRTFTDFFGRPIAILDDGQPIPELV
ncbi:MAG: hypothetical protein JWM11_3871 [Planctomycetaceae bacterium]|nr:hypothetical protein [Planctomycetaceae bacterium]